MYGLGTSAAHVFWAKCYICHKRICNLCKVRKHSLQERQKDHLLPSEFGRQKLRSPSAGDIQQRLCQLEARLGCNQQKQQLPTFHRCENFVNFWVFLSQFLLHETPWMVRKPFVSSWCVPICHAPRAAASCTQAKTKCRTKTNGFGVCHRAISAFAGHAQNRSLRTPDPSHFHHQHKLQRCLPLLDSNTTTHAATVIGLPQYTDSTDENDDESINIVANLW